MSIPLYFLAVYLLGLILVCIIPFELSLSAVFAFIMCFVLLLGAQYWKQGKKDREEFIGDYVQSSNEFYGKVVEANDIPRRSSYRSMRELIIVIVDKQKRTRMIRIEKYDDIKGCQVGEYVAVALHPKHSEVVRKFFRSSIPSDLAEVLDNTDPATMELWTYRIRAEQAAQKREKLLAPRLLDLIVAFIFIMAGVFVLRYLAKEKSSRYVVVYLLHTVYRI